VREIVLPQSQLYLNANNRDLAWLRLGAQFGPALAAPLEETIAFWNGVVAAKRPDLQNLSLYLHTERTTRGFGPLILRGAGHRHGSGSFTMTQAEIDRGTAVEAHPDGVATGEALLFGDDHHWAAPNYGDRLLLILMYRH